MWLTAKEVRGLSGMPGSEQGAKKRLEKLVVGYEDKSRKREGTKATEYHVTVLPEEAREAIQAKQLRDAIRQPLQAPGESTLPATTGKEESKTLAPVKKPDLPAKKDADLTDKERHQRDCALMLVNKLDEIHVLSGSHKSSCRLLAEQIIDGTSQPEIIDAFASIKIHARKSDKSKPRAALIKACSRRLERLLTAWRKGLKIGDPAAYLVPGVRQKEPPKPEHLKAIAIHYNIPSRPRIAEALRNAKPWYEQNGFNYPSVSVWERALRRLPMTVKHRGRMTAGEWKSIISYVGRDVSKFYSNDIWVGDGHSFKAKVSHPVHGRAFTPEVTAVIDWVSRRVVGWSVDLSESTTAVSAALHHAQQQTHGRPLVYYSDNGSGQTGKLIDHEIHGTLSRQGIAHKTGIPGNAQGRGIIERLWQHTTNELARTYPTCIWQSSDKETTRKMLVELNKVSGDDSFVPDWWQFIEDLGRKFEEYNNRPHSVLKGRTPNDEYKRRLDPDSIMYQLREEELAAMWMPALQRVPRRGLVQLWGNLYHNNDLPGMLGDKEPVQVRFDVHNPDQVWIHRLDGRFLCTAQWNGHMRDAFPVSFMDNQREQRKNGRLSRIYSREEEILAEAQTPLIDVTPVSDDVIQMELDKTKEPELIEVEPKKKDFATWLREKKK